MAQQTVQLGRKTDPPPETFIDPVCKMTVTAESAAGTYAYQGHKYYFCAVGCRDRFATDPEKYLSSEHERDHSPEVPTESGGELTDPVCGMKVTPDSAAGKYDYKGET